MILKITVMKNNKCRRKYKRVRREEIRTHNTNKREHQGRVLDRIERLRNLESRTAYLRDNNIGKDFNTKVQCKNTRGHITLH